jgi:hypothetical protein
MGRIGGSRRAKAALMVEVKQAGSWRPDTEEADPPPVVVEQREAALPPQDQAPVQVYPPPRRGHYTKVSATADVEEVREQRTVQVDIWRIFQVIRLVCKNCPNRCI